MYVDCPYWSFAHEYQSFIAVPISLSLNPPPPPSLSPSHCRPPLSPLYVSVYPLLSLPLFLSFSFPLCLSLSVSLSLCLSVHLSVCLSASLLVSLSIPLFSLSIACLSVCLSVAICQSVPSPLFLFLSQSPFFSFYLLSSLLHASLFAPPSLFLHEHSPWSIVASEGPWPGAGRTNKPKNSLRGGRIRAVPNTSRPMMVEAPKGVCKHWCKYHVVLSASIHVSIMLLLVQAFM